MKLLLSYHKPDYLFKDSVLMPIHAGRELAMNRMDECDEKRKWLLENTQGDDLGDNISRKNGTYNEMTTVYWAWKNYDVLGNPDYIGFMHYRRHFVFNPNLTKHTYESRDITENYFNRINYDENEVVQIMEDCDFVCTKPQWRKSMYEHFRLNHEIEDLDTAIEILKEKYPEYAEAADNYLNGHDAYFCNMFIFPKEIFFQYASWFFDITLELEKRIDFTYKRLFVSEWLTGIFITYLKMQGKKGKYLPMMIAEGEHEIPIVMAADNGYAYPMMVAIASLLNTAKPNTAYIFNLLISEDFSDENKKFIERICESNVKCKYNFIEMHDAYEEAHIAIKHITTATYYRLQLPTLLENIGKCIYLDVDLIAKKDLSAMYRICVDDKYIAGVRALGYYETEEKIERKKATLEIDCLDDYINAGVLLMNLAKIRRDGIEQRFEELLEKNFPSQDQDILNCACVGRIRRLPFKYNAMTKYPLYSDVAYANTKYMHKWIEESDWDNGRKDPVIIHYADKKKPWNDMSAYYAKDWWEVVATLPADISVKITSFYLGNLVQSAYDVEQKRRLAVSHKRDALAENKRLKKKVKNESLKQKEALNEVKKIKNSKEYKLGKKLLFIPRKIKGGIKCVKDHGVFYTIKHALKKLLGKK